MDESYLFFEYPWKPGAYTVKLQFLPKVLGSVTGWVVTEQLQLLESIHE